jgi:hypothetical protein
MPTVSEGIREKLPALKQDLTQASTFVHTLVITAISGAASASYQVLADVGHEQDLFSAAGIQRLKHSFIYGAALSIIALFAPSPLKATVGGAPVNPAPTSTPSFVPSSTEK